MPCRDYDTIDYASEYRDRLNEREAMLCAVLTALEDRVSPHTKDKLDWIFRNIDWKEAGVSRGKLEDWWEGHKIRDKHRREREAELKRVEELKNEALKKLTKEELKALGLVK